MLRHLLGRKLRQIHVDKEATQNLAMCLSPGLMLRKLKLHTGPSGGRGGNRWGKRQFYKPIDSKDEKFT